MKNEMDVILIKPDIIDHQVTKDSTRGPVVTPHGLLYTAAMLRDKGYKILIIDEVLEKDPYNLLSDALNSNPICVGLGVTSGSQIKNGLKFASIVRKKSNIPIIWGGPHPAEWPEQTLEDDLVDAIVMGESEISFPNLVKSYENNDSLADIKGIGYKDTNGIHINLPENPVELDDIPRMPYDLIDMEAYMAHLNKNKISRGVEMVTSRGCPYRCTFCHQSILKEKWRYRSAERMVDDIEYLIENYQADGILFEDELYFTRKHRVFEFCEEMVKRNIKIVIRGAAVRCNLFSSLTEAELKLLKKAGFDHFGIGIESGSERILVDVLDKGINHDQIYDTNDIMKEYGFAVTYNFMSGIPGETLKDYVKTLKLMYHLLRTNEHLIAPVGVPKFFYPYTNTILGNKCIAEYGFKFPKTFRDWGNYQYINDGCSWRTPEFDRLAIKAMDIILNLRPKFIGENSNINEDDYQPLLNLIDEVKSVASSAKNITNTTEQISA